MAVARDWNNHVRVCPVGLTQEQVRLFSWKRWCIDSVTSEENVGLAIPIEVGNDSLPGMYASAGCCEQG